MSRHSYLVAWVFGLAGIGFACSDDSSGTTPDVGVEHRETGPGPDVAIDHSTTKLDQSIATVDQSTVKADQGATTGGGYGSKCSQSKPCADPTMMCATITSGADGFCTKQCPKLGEECSTGVPAGMRALCTLDSGAGKFYCAFVCKFSETAYPCPSELSCKVDNYATKLCAP